MDKQQLADGGPPPPQYYQQEQPPSSNPNDAPPPAYAYNAQAPVAPYQQQQFPQQPHGQQFNFQPQQYTGYGQTTQSPVVVSQPGYAAPIVNYAPQTHAALAWLTCLFCFWPLGLAAIIKSNEVDSSMRRGDVNGAMAASKNARLYSMISIGLGIGSYIICVMIIVIYISVLNTKSSYGWN